MYLWAILRVAVLSYPVGGQVFPNGCNPCSRWFAKGWFPKEWFWRMFPGTKNWNEGTSGCSRHQNPERGFPGTKSRNKGTFAKTALLQNRPFVSSRSFPFFYMSSPMLLLLLLLLPPAASHSFAFPIISTFCLSFFPPQNILDLI